MPEIWRLAAAKTLLGESVESLSLPKSSTKHYGPTPPSGGQPGIILVNKKIAAIKFPFDRALLERFKLEIDGRTWNAEGGYWEIPAVKLPRAVEVFGGMNAVKMGPGVKELIETELLRREDLDVIRDKDDTRLHIPGLILPLRNYQRVAVEFCVRAGGRALIADDMGLGKTVESLAYAILEKRKTLIVCPATVKINWEREIEKFTGLKAVMWDSKGKVGRVTGQFHVVNYDAVIKQIQNLRKIPFDLLICDESSFLKNRKTLRAKAILGSFRERRKFPGIQTDDVIFLTGTPVLNRPTEAFYLLSFLSKERFTNFFHFTQKYGGWKGDPPRHLDDLHDRTKDLIIRRRKTDVLKELPPKSRSHTYIELPTTELANYHKHLHDMFSKWQTAGRPSIAEMPSLQKYLAQHKLPRAWEMIDELMEAGRTVLLFSNYLDPLKATMKHYGPKAALLTGEMSLPERQVTIDKIQNGEALLGCISIKAGGMGINLTKADTVIFLDCDWVPATHMQAEDRTHRIGQVNPVQVFYMVVADTVDEDMIAILSEKQKIIDQIVDGEVFTDLGSKSIFNDVVKRIKLRYTETMNEKK